MIAKKAVTLKMINLKSRTPLKNRKVIKFQMEKLKHQRRRTPIIQMDRIVSHQKFHLDLSKQQKIPFELSRD